MINNTSTINNLTSLQFLCLCFIYSKFSLNQSSTQHFKSVACRAPLIVCQNRFVKQHSSNLSPFFTFITVLYSQLFFPILLQSCIKYQSCRHIICIQTHKHKRTKIARWLVFSFHKLLTWALDGVVQLINALNYFPTVSLPELIWNTVVKIQVKTDDSTRPRYNFCF